MKLKTLAIALLTVTAMSTVSVSSVFAENSEEGAPQNKTEFLKEREAKVTERAEKMEERKNEIEAKATERAKKVEERKNEIEAKATERAGKIEERKDEIEAKVTQRAGEKQERRTEIAQKHAINLELHFNAHYKRLATMADKIQTRINTFKSEGKDVSVAQAKLDSAKASLETAKSLGLEAIAAFKAIDPTQYEEQRDQALAAKQKAEQARKAFMTALEGMKETVKALKELRSSETE